MDKIPILKMGDLLLITIQTDLYDRLSIQLKDDIAECLSKYRSRGVLIDISSLSLVDSFLGKIINNIASISLLMDAEMVLVGMQPSVAISLVELGLCMPKVNTAISVEAAILLLQEKNNTL